MQSSMLDFKISDIEFYAWKKRLLILTASLAALFLLVLSLSHWSTANLWVIVATAYFVIGFYLVEFIGLVLSQKRKANAAALVLIFGGKLVWWLAAFLAVYFLPEAARVPVVVGCAAFFLALSINAFFLFGLPKLEIR